MVHFPSSYSYDELIEKWDEYTSPARFAGNDETMDLIFVSKRNNENIKLVRKAQNAFEPFSTVFRGKIKRNEQGSEIVGSFTKTVIDYCLVAGVLALLFYIRSIIMERGAEANTINVLLTIAIIAGISFLICTRPTKRRYADFICRITGTDVSLFLSRKVQKDKEQDNQSQ